MERLRALSLPRFAGRGQHSELKYHAVADAVAELGSAASIREAFIGFQKNLYESRSAA